MRIEVASATLRDGTTVCDACYRLADEREAICIVRTEGKAARRDELDRIEKRSGRVARDRIAALVEALWPEREALL